MTSQLYLDLKKRFKEDNKGVEDKYQEIIAVLENLSDSDVLLGSKKFFFSDLNYEPTCELCEKLSSDGFIPGFEMSPKGYTLHVTWSR